MSEEEKKELDVYEARVTNKQYSDYDWRLTGYTSELRNNDDDSFFAIVDFNEDGIGTIRECQHCLEYGFHYRLGPKIKKEGEPVAPDDDQFLSCYECGNTFGIHETFQESKIKDSLETVQNPFEGTESVFLSIDNRAIQRRKGIQRKSGRLKSQEQEDPEIQAEIDKGNTVKILYDSNR